MLCLCANNLKSAASPRNTCLKITKLHLASGPRRSEKIVHRCRPISYYICIYSFIHSFITRFTIRRSGALQQAFYGSPPSCPVLGSPPPI